MDSKELIAAAERAESIQATIKDIKLMANYVLANVNEDDGELIKHRHLDPHYKRITDTPTLIDWLIGHVERDNHIMCDITIRWISASLHCRESWAVFVGNQWVMEYPTGIQLRNLLQSLKGGA